MLEAMNERIAFLYDREHTIGHSYFWGLKNNGTIEAISAVFRQNVIPLLKEYFYEDYGKIRMILSDNAKADEYQFIKILVDEDEFDKVFRKTLDDSDSYGRGRTVYEVQDAAFEKIESYIGIYKEL